MRERMSHLLMSKDRETAEQAVACGNLQKRLTQDTGMVDRPAKYAVSGGSESLKTLLKVTTIQV